METRVIESLNREVSRIGLGTWAIGGFMWGGTNETDSIRAIRSAIDRGISLIDTAPIYGFGLSEEIVGRALQEHGNREQIVLSTKVGLDWREGNIFRNNSRARIMKEIDDSLRRLRTDYIDIYFVHWPDPNTSVKETAEAMNELFHAEKIRAIGVSNFSPIEMDTFSQSAPLQIAQPPYNLFEREIEDDVMPFCKNNNIALMTYGVLCRGMLSGKMSLERGFKGDDLRRIDPKFQPPRFEQYLKTVAKLDRYAREKYNKRIIHLAVRWVLDQEADIALWGARTPEHLNALDEVSGWSLSEEERQEIGHIIDSTIDEPIGPEFMAPPTGIAVL